MVSIDNRSKSDITQQLRERAASYTPEWNMSDSNPDIASALAAAYADMFASTLKKVNGVPYKNKIAFYNMTNASLLSSVPSSGYVSFALASSDVGNTQVTANTVLTAQTENGDIIHFETTDDVLVSGASIERIFCADDSEDYIGEYEFKEDKFHLFDKPGENLQSHVLYIAHPYIFDIVHGATIGLAFWQRGEVAVSAACIKALADKDAALIEYYAGDEKGYVPFEKVHEENGRLYLHKGDFQPRIFPVQEEDGQIFTIRITVFDVQRFDKLAFLRAEASSSSDKIECETVSDGNTYFEKTRFFPFGERFQLYNEVYFGCREVLNKCGAEVTMNFNISYENIPIENQLPDDEINFKWIAKKDDFKRSRDYDITITEVIWEYYNGAGWNRLFKDSSYSRVFNIGQGVRELYRNIKFLCPEDMSPVFVGAEENFFIRARILKADNLYKLRGQYISPVISNLSFDYSFSDGWRILSRLSAKNNLETKSFEPSENLINGGFKPFYRTGVDFRAVYLGFSAPPDSGPFRILWDISENEQTEQPVLLWEYLSDKGWHPMNMADETTGFLKSGLTVFLDNPRFKKTALFSNELFWVRITDLNSFFKVITESYPLVNGIYSNSVRAINTDSHKEELFSLGFYEENAQLKLSDQNVLDFELFVSETDTIAQTELEILESKNLVRKTTDKTGLVTEVWIKWTEVNSFLSQSKDSRCYIIDKSNGIVTFGNGRNGRIPSVSDEKNIRVVYSTGGGDHTNVSPGTINHLERAVGFVMGVTNPKRFNGGCDTETVDDAMRRSAVMIRTQGKAVTSRDYERLALNAERTIKSVKCFAGYNFEGEREVGAVTLVLIRSDNSDFSRVKKLVYDYMLPRISGGISSSEKLYITEPEFVCVNVRVSVSVNSMNKVFDTKKAIEEKLGQYLDALNGGFDNSGWRIGNLPNEQQIRSCILGIENIVYIKSLYISLNLASGGEEAEIDAQAAKNHKYLLVQNGKHEIVISLS